MNEEKFTGRANVYDRYRPSYPAELIDWIYERTGAETVADIGAGTGKFTVLLTAKPWKIIAVEPNADMMEKLKENVPTAELVSASAENTGIAERSVGLVTTAMAFHWFNEELFKRECQRILVPDGKLAVIWYDRIENELNTERSEAVRKYCGLKREAVEKKQNHHQNDGYLRGGFFSEAEVFRKDTPIIMDEEHFIGDNLSRSHALREGEENFDKYVEALREVYKKHEVNGAVEVPYKITCYLGKL